MAIVTCFECKPKWKQLVDAVFMKDMDPNASQKLVNYCIHKTDKLYRIVRRLQQYLNHYLKRRKEKYVQRIMTVMDRVVVNCHQQMNHFVCPYLTMVQLLLEQSEQDFQLLGAASFVEFCKIEEETPNYHREYDALLEHFTRMCVQKKNFKVRKSGLEGIEGIITKTSNDMLQVNPYESYCIDKIIPSLLFNITITSHAEESEEADVSFKAVEVFHRIIRWSTSHNLKPVVTAVLQHLDDNEKWESGDHFATFIFQQISEASQSSQSGHRVVKMLIEHLDTNKANAPCPQRIHVVEVISHIITGLARNAVGPDLFQIFKMLLEILRSSIEKTEHQDNANVCIHRVETIIRRHIHADGSLLSSDEGSTCSTAGKVELQEERLFQEAVIKAIGEFARNLPDEQMLVVLKFILNFNVVIHMQCDNPRPCATLMKRLLETVFLISKLYHSDSPIANSLTADFLPTLLAKGEDPDVEIRLLVQSILHSFLDRHENLDKLRKLTLYQNSCDFEGICWDKPQREDVWFLKRGGQQLLDHLFKQLVDPMNSRRHCLRYLACTVNLLIVELGPDSSGEAAMEIMKLLLLLQDRAISYSDDLQTIESPPTKMDTASHPLSDLEAISFTLDKVDYPHLSVVHRCRILSLIASHMMLLCHTMSHPNVASLRDYVEQVVKERGLHSPHLLPHFAFDKTLPSYSFPAKLEVRESELFQESVLIEHFEDMGFNTFRMRVALREVHRRLSLFDYMDAALLKQPSSIIAEEVAEEKTDEDEYDGQLDSLPSSGECTPLMLRRRSHLDEYSFTEMKKVICQSNEIWAKRKTKEQERLLQQFREASFSEICENQHVKSQKSRNFFYRIADCPASAASTEGKMKFSFSNLPRKDRRSSSGSGADSISCRSSTPPLTAHFGQVAPTVWEISYPSMLEL